MQRPTTAAFVALVVLCSLGLTAGAVTGANTDIAIEAVNLSVDDPAPGEPFTLRTTVRNLQTSEGPVDITDIYVRRGSSTTEYARVENVGTVANGSALTVPMTVRIDDAGQRRLVVFVVVRDIDGEFRRVEYPLFVDVQPPDEAAISVANLDAVAGQEQRINVTVSNGDSGTLSNVRLDLVGDATIDNPERVTASLGAGTQVTHPFDVTFPGVGPQTLNATVQYRTARGATRTIHREVTADVDAASVDADLTTTVTQTNGTAGVRASLTQYGNVDLRNVQIRAVADDRVYTRVPVPDVPVDGTRSVTLDGADLPEGNVSVVAAYTAAGEERTTSAVVPITVDPALSVRTAAANDSSVIRASLTQYGNVELTDVAISVRVEDAVVTRTPLPTVPANGTRTVTLDSEAVPPGEVTVVAEYTAGGRRRTAEETLQYRPTTPANITLTSVEVTRQGSTLVLSGDAANVGSLDARGLLVSVVETDGVASTPPNGEYFVGTVQTSEFATFDLTANASTGVERIPVRLSYSVDGEQYTQVRSVDVTGGASSGGNGSEAGGARLVGGPALAAIAGLLALLGVGIVLYRWRRR